MTDGNKIARGVISGTLGKALFTTDGEQWWITKCGTSCPVEATDTDIVDFDLRARDKLLFESQSVKSMEDKLLSATRAASIQILSLLLLEENEDPEMRLDLEIQSKALDELVPLLEDKWAVEFALRRMIAAGILSKQTTSIERIPQVVDDFFEQVVSLTSTAFTLEKALNYVTLSINREEFLSASLLEGVFLEICRYLVGSSSIANVHSVYKDAISFRALPSSFQAMEEWIGVVGHHQRGTTYKILSVELMESLVPEKPFFYPLKRSKDEAA